MNRRKLLGVAGAIGAGVTLGGGRVLANNHGNVEDNTLIAPVGNQHLHFCGIHCAKKDPRFQVVTQHFCGMPGQAGVEMHQCLLYDGVGKGAKLLGIEYIVSDEIFWKLPDEEKRYWHPHTYEVLGGGLIAPSMKPVDEMAFMKGLLLTWGKAWHTWPDPSTPVPMGEPLLVWSLTGDGQHDPKLIAARDNEFGVSTAEIRKARIEAIGYEAPAVPPPKDVNVIGRQWTADGADKPTPRKS